MELAQRVQDMTDEELLREHDFLVPLAMRLSELETEMSKRAHAKTDALLAAESREEEVTRRIANILKQ